MKTPEGEFPCASRVCGWEFAPLIDEQRGDTLRVRYALSGVQRPKEFKTGKGSQLYLVTYNRKKQCFQWEGP